MIDVLKKDLEEKYKDRPDRLKHIYGVVKKAKELGSKLNLDLNKLEIAALMHDFTKYDDLEDQKSYLNAEEIELYKNEVVVYHALSAATYLKNTYKINDSDILDAIRFHVFGSPKMNQYAKVVLIADKIEETRTYPTVNYLRELADISIDKAILAYLEVTKQRLLDKQLPIHPLMNETIKMLGE
ncbi:bis(5'-nucleosyl)-tetraphosphatase (symmetrical) YqeK [Acholeplasma equirhinis]|uniref:bis(5'-nucleosyl)-tetraphosphatase (symmetrical) YqeK n=1 Tax=Acholeplasma equirhinis TaxID=555393 RepID=UPI00197ADE4F|nr:bis(5'-nucleosyl)-tetraphosphatase (symmetrical) YqeK [Acholeplasma equirhinis]MBN3490586.1 bis(5'-nucleosyl)-tetraphosphatase (symmetrical) YqeK [Acholeplasma equirhinis]